MARGADLPPDSGEDDADSPFDLNRLLRFVEGLVFCCLAAMVIFWAVDRSRNVSFDPVTVEICDSQSCAPAPDSESDGALALYSETLDLGGLSVFSAVNTCVFAAEILQSRATHPGADLALELMQNRGTISVVRTGDGMATIAPGSNNDGLEDVVRDAFRWRGPRGCHPMKYGPVFWPLCAVWMLLLGWRFLRYRQSVWAARDT